MRPHLYMPAAMSQRLTASPENPIEDRKNHGFDVKGRLKAGVTREQAQAELATIWKGLEPLHSAADQNRVVRVRSELQARVVQDPPDAYLITLLMVLVGVVLIIACANVANLLLCLAVGCCDNCLRKACYWQFSEPSSDSPSRMGVYVSCRRSAFQRTCQS